MQQSLHTLVSRVAQLLERTRLKIVFAESCTGGLIAAALARIPGVSHFHCGSAVVYRLDTKTKWLGVPSEMLIDPGPVSEPVARAMAQGVLAVSPEADIAATITGHLGPGAPPDQDGRIYSGIVFRGARCEVFEHRISDSILLKSRFPGETQREQRQWAAVEFVLERVRDGLEQTVQNTTPND